VQVTEEDLKLWLLIWWGQFQKGILELWSGVIRIGSEFWGILAGAEITGTPSKVKSGNQVLPSKQNEHL
jgi:hypothetical protein